MATLQRATYTGRDDILKAYDAVVDSIPGGCFYSVWVSQKEISFQCIDDDAAKAKKMLDAYLESLETAENDDLFYLKFHPADKGFIKRETLVICMFPVRVCPVGEGKLIAGNESGYQRQPDMNYKLYKMLEDMPAAIDLKIKTAIDAHMAEYEDFDQEPEPDPVQKTIGIINGLAQNPQIMAIVGQVLNFLKPAGFRPPVAINGMTEQNGVQTEIPGTEPVPVNEEILNEAISRLHKHCRVDTDLLLLADMADNDPGTFQMLLGMLRKK